MALPTTKITGQINLPDGSLPSASWIEFQLTGFDTDAAEDITILQQVRRFHLDVNGNLDADLWANDDGVRSTFYRVTASAKAAYGNDRRTFGLGLIEVPSGGGTYDLNDLLPISPPAGASVSEYIAQLAASVASTDAASATAVAAADTAVAAATPAAELIANVRVTRDAFTDLASVTSGDLAVGEYAYIVGIGAWYERAPDAATDEHLDYSGGVGVKWYVHSGPLGYNVKAFGAVGDNVTDDSAAFIAAVTAAFNDRQTVGTAPNPLIGVRVFLPSTDGAYLLSQPESLMPNLGSQRASGLTIEGEARGSIVRVGFTSDDYLAYNNNQFLQVLFRNITFDANGNDVKFLFTTANGGAQDYIFENCFWSGTWEKLWVLRGLDNNSEWRFNSCGMNAYVQDVAMDVSDSDQFLNYWHVNCKWWLREGQFMRATDGGHHHYFNCDFSGLEPTMSNNTSTNGAFMFELTGRAHARGTCVFVMRDCRFEHKVPLSKLIYCEWNQGSVLFDNCDFNSNLYADDAAPNTEHARFDFENVRGPVVSWENCSLQGQHVYRYGVNAWQQDHRVKYDGCQIAWGEINDLIKVEANTTGIGAHTNFGGAPLITVDNSVVEPWYADGTPDVISNFTTVCFDADINGSTSRSSASKVRQFVMRNPQGGGTPTTTSGDFTLTMPQNVIITRVTWINNGSLTSIVVPDFQLKDGAGNVISSQSGALNASAIVEDAVHYNIGTDNVLTLTDANAVANQSGPGVYCLIEYMGG